MTVPYKIIGIEPSPYSIKVRAYFRYRQLPYTWHSRFAEEATFQARAKLPLIPLVLTPDDQAMQDSTPIVESLEATRPPESGPSIHPEGAALAFLSALLEEFGDEWGNKLMFHFRWADEADQANAALRIARSAQPHGESAQVAMVATAVRQRMVGRGHFVGSNEKTAPLIESYFDQLIPLLEAHLQTRVFLFGGRPSFGDFGLGAQFYAMAMDPTCGAILSARAERVLAWSYRVSDPTNLGPFEPFDSLAPTLIPLLKYVGTYFLPWSRANARAIASGAAAFRVELAGETYEQPPQKYHARSLRKLMDRYQAVPDKTELDPILDAAGCLDGIKQPIEP